MSGVYDDDKSRETLLEENEVLRRERDDVRSVIDGMPDAVAVCGAPGILLVNETLVEWLGYAHPFELVGMPVDALAHPDDQAVLAAMLWMAAERGAEGAGEAIRFRRGDGSVMRAWASASSLRYAGTNCALLVVRAAPPPAAGPSRLALLETAVDHMHDIVFITEAEPRDPAGRRIVFVNEAFVRITGYKAEEVLGKTPSITIGDETDRETLKRIAAALAERRAVHEELQKYRKDGTTYWVELDIIPIYDAAGAHTHWLSVQRDVTDRKLMQSRLADSARLASLGTLAAGVAHEVNNPLAFVAGNLEYLEESIGALARGAAAAGETALANEARAALRDAREGVQRMGRIVRDLKLFSRAGEEKRQRVDVARAIDSSLNIAASALRGRARVERDFHGAPCVVADESRLVQVFVNLLMNAAQSFAEGGESRCVVRVSARADGAGRVAVEVRDNGCGIPPSALARVFEPFFTTRGQGAGTGLGLSICHGIVTAMGGEIQVESEVNVGTTVRVALPAAPDSARPLTPAPGFGSRALTPDPDQARPRVLIADDEPALCDFVRRALGGAYECVVARDGREALDRLVEDPVAYAVVLCDLIMPKLNGMEVYYAARELGVGVERRFVFMTGGAVSAATRQFLETLPNDKLEKPFEVNAVRTAVRRRVRGE